MQHRSKLLDFLQKTTPSNQETVMEVYYLSQKGKKLGRSTALTKDEKAYCVHADKLLNALVPEKKNHTKQLMHRMLTIAQLSQYFQDKQTELNQNQHKLLGVRKLIELLIYPPMLQSPYVELFIHSAIGDISWIETTLKGRLEKIIAFAVLEKGGLGEAKFSHDHIKKMYDTIATFYHQGKMLPKSDYFAALYHAKSTDENAITEQSLSEQADEKSISMPSDSLSTESGSSAMLSTSSPSSALSSTFAYSSPLSDTKESELSRSESTSVQSDNSQQDGDFAHDLEDKEKNPLEISTEEPHGIVRSDVSLSEWIQSNKSLVVDEKKKSEDNKEEKEDDYYKKIQSYIQQAIDIKLSNSQAKREARKFEKLKNQIGNLRASRILLCNIALSNLKVDPTTPNSVYFLFSLISDIRDQLLYNRNALPAEILQSICGNKRFLLVNEKLRNKKDVNKKLFYQLWLQLNLKVEKENIPDHKNIDHDVLSEACDQDNLLAHYFKTIDKNEMTSTNTLFNSREGNKILEFYSNAYNNEEKDSGAFFDICQDIDNAKKSIVLTGWTIRLDWNMGMLDDKTLLQRFLDAAKRGVKVCILVWDVSRFVDGHNKDLENINNKIITMAKEQGIEGVEKHIFIKVANRELGYSDHAKIVIIDGKKMYAGGLDLTINRENPSTWHDCHVAVTGPVIQDALTLVKGRWAAESSTYKFPKSYISNKDTNIADVIALAAFDEAIASSKSSTLKEEKKKESTPTAPTPTIQLLTSIKRQNWNSQAGEWKVAGEYTNEIARAYVKTIQEAKNFIYMENQYFVGPRYHTGTKKTKNPKDNPVIAEIVKKIIEKHKNGEEFHFYCQLPYIPDGDDATKLVTSTQVRKTWKTVDWFRQEIDKATNGNSHKYITFYHLGQYSKEHKGFLQKYTHSKLLIADDNKLIIGSANCNERSMAGNNDHEIVMLMKNQNKQIKDYRVALMKEHFGAGIEKEDIIINHPESPTAAVLLNKLADKNNEVISKHKKDFDHVKHGYAVGYGLLSRNEFLKGQRPAHVPKRTKILGRPTLLSTLVR